jgi:hypothetical protein
MHSHITMSEIPFWFRALSDLSTGILIIAPLIYALESIIFLFVKPSPLQLSETLRRIALPEPMILLIIALVWTLILAVSDNVGISWLW